MSKRYEPFAFKDKRSNCPSWGVRRVSDGFVLHYSPVSGPIRFPFKCVAQDHCQRTMTRFRYFLPIDKGELSNDET